MKNIQLKFLFLLLLNPFLLMSQDINNKQKEVVISNIKSLETFITEENFKEAYYYADELKFNIMVLYGLKISKMICPDEIYDFKSIPDGASNEINGDDITFVREYAEPLNDTVYKKETVIRIVYSNTDPIIDKIAKINAFSYELIDTNEKMYKPIMIKGNPSLLVFDEGREFTSIATALSPKVSVRIDVWGGKNIELAMNVTKQLDYAKIKEILDTDH